jgi:hypothetical protein
MNHKKLRGCTTRNGCRCPMVSRLFRTCGGHEPPGDEVVSRACSQPRRHQEAPAAGTEVCEHELAEAMLLASRLSEPANRAAAAASVRRLIRARRRVAEHVDARAAPQDGRKIRVEHALAAGCLLARARCQM